MWTTPKSAVYWVVAAILSFGANVAWKAGMQGLCIQAVVMSVGCFIYGARYIKPEE